MSVDDTNPAGIDATDPQTQSDIVDDGDSLSAAELSAILGVDAPDNNIIPFPGTSANAAANASTGSTGSRTASGGSPSGDPHTWTRQMVWAIRYHKKYNEHQKRVILHNFIVTHEKRKGTANPFVVANGKAYLLDQHKCRLYRIELKDDEFLGYLYSRYGFNGQETTTKHLVSSLRAHTFANGARRDVHRFVHYDRVAQVLYVSRYDGTCYRLDGSGEFKRVANGDGVLFLDDDRGVTCNEPVIGNHHELFKQLIDDLNYVPTTAGATAGSMSPEIQKTCLGVWMFAIAFPDLMPTKPLLLVEGLAGSGKTTALQRIAHTLHGRDKPLTVTKKEDPDFGVKILRSPIAILDDVNTHIEWLQDTLCTYATGGTWITRKKYKDDEEHEIKPESFLSITTNNPTTFRQGQLADRCLVLRLHRRVGDFTSAEQLLAQVDDWRPELQGEWLYWLNEIVRELRKPQRLMTSPYRMADFARLAHLIGRVLNQPAGPPGNWSPEAVDEMLGAMQAERDALVLEGDTLPALLDKWLDGTHEGQPNEGREVSARDLHAELALIATTANVEFTARYKNALALSARLRSASAALSRRFEVAKAKGNGNLAEYSFQRRRGEL